jgi:hypothetical protein
MTQRHTTTHEADTIISVQQKNSLTFSSFFLSFLVSSLQGLITYTANAILWNNQTGTIAQLQRIALVVAHELSHQWFGNLVTAAWWSQLWLNEGKSNIILQTPLASH